MVATIDQHRLSAQSAQVLTSNGRESFEVANTQHLSESRDLLEPGVQACK